MLFSSDKMAHRLFVVVLLGGIVALSCLYHGISEKKHTLNLYSQMHKNGEIRGAFWRVKEFGNSWIRFTKFNKTIVLNYNGPQNFKIMDKVSFIAVKKAGTDNTENWEPVKIHFHGTSVFKFIVSAIALIIAGIMSIVSFGFNKTTLSLTFKK